MRAAVERAGLDPQRYDDVIMGESRYGGGDMARFDTFANLPWIPFPGGRMFRAQYSTLGSWWYAIKDRLGV